MFSNNNISTIPPGAILRMLYSNLDQRERVEFYGRYLPIDEFPDLYGSKLGLEGEAADVPVPELVEELTRKDQYNEDQDEVEVPWHLEKALSELKMSTELLREMRTSMHPPHKFMEGKKVPNAAFPYCYYEDKDVEGTKTGPYDARYCDSFQVIVKIEA